MTAQIFSFLRRPPETSDWTTGEISEFYRVEGALVQAGLSLFSDRGVSDEGDPWFIFCRTDTEEVFIHFARIDGQYVIDGAVFDTAARGANFTELVRELISRHPLAMARTRERPGTNVFLHPATLLIALVGTAFFHSTEAKAAESPDLRTEAKRPLSQGLAHLVGGARVPDVVVMDASQTAAILAGAMIVMRDERALAPPPLQAPSTAAMDEAAAMRYLMSSAPPPAFEIASAPAASPAPAVEASNLSGPSVRGLLTLIAVLHDLADLSIAPAPAAVQPSIFPAPAQGPEGDITPVAAPPWGLGIAVSYADRPVFIVRLSANVLPDIEAVHIVQESGVLAHFDPSNIAQFEHLPSILAELIGKGAHINASDMPHAIPPAVETSDSVTQSPPVILVNPQTPPPPVSHDPSPPTLYGHSAEIDAAVARFSTEAVKLDVVLNGRNIVLYDSHIFDPLPAGTKLDSVTFAFSDGSSISLVGTAQELHAFHLLH